MTTGAFLTWQSGTPLNEFGANPAYFRGTFLVPRGSAGRTPVVWDLDLRFAYPFHVGARPRRPSNARLAARRQTTSAGLARAGPVRLGGRERQAQQSQPDLRPGARYQPPTQARLGVEFTF